MLNRHRIIALGAAVMALALGACATKIPPKDYSAFRMQNPKAVLVVPAVNRSVDIDAPDYFLATITRPLAERGYYVFPVHMVKRIMEDDGLSDADLVHQADTKRLATLFGADAVLYVTIHQWDAKYLVLNTTVTVDIEYVIKGADGSVLWADRRQMQYSPQSASSGNLIADLIVMAAQAAVTKAAPNYLPLTRQANALAIYTEGQGLPAGPHHANYLKDHKQFQVFAVKGDTVPDEAAAAVADADSPDAAEAAKETPDAEAAPVTDASAADSE